VTVFLKALIKIDSKIGIAGLRVCQLMFVMKLFILKSAVTRPALD
jgi:hypothetical protein